METRLSNEQGIRVAVEGCVSDLSLTSVTELKVDDLNKGHGTLNAIYASIQKSCELKGWDGVDVLIIGGDFQVYRHACEPRNIQNIKITRPGSPQQLRSELHVCSGQVSGNRGLP